MNYYQHHIGDFNNATRHLTRVERSIYRDMVELYYDTEKALPADVAVICRKVVARTEEEKAAVLALLDEFFIKTESGFMHERCEEELSNAREAMTEAKDRRQNEKERQRRNRERRADLFSKLREYDEVPAWNTSTEVLLSRVEYHLSRVTGADRTSTSHACTAPATATHYPLPTTHLPLPSTQYPIEEQHPATADAAPAKKKAGSAKKQAKAEPGTGRVWIAYAKAYWDRYGVEPVRNAMVNGQFSNMVKRLGVDDAEGVAGFFVTHNSRFYVEKMHPVGVMLQDCEKLRTEWATGRTVTAAAAKEADRLQEAGDMWNRIIEQQEN